MIEKVKEALQRIEKKEGVRVIYACESGSRAWGFESTDSDYDVRFIYVHPLDWYLSIGDQEEIIELPVDGKLDINGWDIRKSLNLLRKSNSVILEWLVSPITYRKHDLDVAPLAEVAQKAFMPGSSFHHYLGMATRSLAGCQAVERVKIKSYLYAVRPTLCCRWIVKYRKQPPMLLDDLIAEFLPDRDSDLRQYIDRIIRVKKEADEGVCVDRSPLLENYLHSQLAELQNVIPENPPKLPLEEFNDVFKTIVSRW
jgi:predicted nucleotidyltransferase